MKIAISLVVLTTGGAERFASTLANYLTEKGDEVSIICSYKEPSFHYKLDERIRVFEIFPKERYKDGIIHYFGTFNRMLIVRKLIKEIKPDILFSFYSNNSTQDTLSTIGLNTPVVIGERDAFFMNSGKRSEFIRKITYKLASGFVYQTTFAKEILERYNLKNKPSIVLKNPVYINDYPDEIDICSKMKIVCAGRLDKNKNFIGVIRAFSLIANNYKNIILEIYGDGPELNNLKNEAEKLNIDNQVYFRGITNNIVEALVGARCFVLFSNLEGYPNILLEAMAVGVPVIASDCPVGACSELIKENETGLLVSVGSVNELANKIDYILSNVEESKIMAEKARYVRTANHKSIICRSFRDFLDVIVGN